jgi:glycosyltransferase involved in cell wall biosynthesis
MRVLVYLYFPPLRSHLPGGAQQFARDLLQGFARHGVEMEILCPEAEDQPLLDLGPDVAISPVLVEESDRPLTPYQRLWNARAYCARGAGADVVLSFDRGVPAELDVPVVQSLNNFTYATQVEAVFGLAWDELVVPSSYLADCVAAVAGPQAWTGSPPPIHTVPYGVDTTHYRPRDPGELLQRLGLDPARRFLLFPHRPDPAKGVGAALTAVALAVRSDRRLQLLLPLPPRSVAAVRDTEARFIAEVREQVTALGLTDHVRFHPWISVEDMPAYYSLGTACLALGTFPETFGFTPVQAIACGTPAIAAPAGAVPTLLPPGHGLELVPFDDAAAVASALTNLPAATDVAAGREFIATAYSPGAAVRGYLSVLRGAARRTGRYRPAGDDLVMPPWCRLLPDGRRWHDYEGTVAGNDTDPATPEEMQRRGFAVPRFGLF